ncbi:putative sulfite reductase [NADPH] flavoprotein component [Grifola frondosa]|uniref:assimilatory sulfite reductase (NADPH) n=1 Tax=Grifola frondosa TaxID=5627 RepID=A0A1C7MKK5_GRIFR|nr:putative sulfite reductase [NADPH] flavoprotein component [Grifola frondosa]
MAGNLHVLAHPLVNARLSKLRQTTTNAKEFREGIHDISVILGIEASRDLEEETFAGQTPIGPFTGSMIKPRIGLTPILRAGLGMTDALLTLFPDAHIYHLGIFREKVSLQPVEYYSKLPPNPTVDMVFLLDPLIATGGTACAAMNMVLEWGIPLTKVKLLCVLASQEGLKRVQSEYPGVEIWVAGVDPDLTSRGLISPGLGDTGDRWKPPQVEQPRGVSGYLQVDMPIVRIATRTRRATHSRPRDVDITPSLAWIAQSLDRCSVCKVFPLKVRINIKVCQAWFTHTASYSFPVSYAMGDIEQSGTSTPLSSTTTLSAPPSPKLKAIPNDLKNLAGNRAVSASTAIEYIASRSSSSSSVFVYDLAEQASFGTLTKSWAESSSDMASVVSLQTRAGAGLSLAGRLSQGSSKDAAKGAILTAYTTPSGLAPMVQSLSQLPPATPSSRLIIQVPTVTPVGERFALSPTLAPFTPALALLPKNFTVLLSATPQEAVDLTLLSYQVSNTHAIHLFDHHSATRETGHIIIPPALHEENLSLEEGLARAGYSAFDYAGDQNAHTVLVLLNGPAMGRGCLAKRHPSLRTARHVFEDVPTATTQSVLYLDVFGALLDPSSAGLIVKSHRIVPARTQEFINTPSSLTTFVLSLVPGAVLLPAQDVHHFKKLIFFSTPGAPLSALARLAEQTFTSMCTISARHLTDYDAFSKAGGVTADRILLSPKDDLSDFLPMSTILPIMPGSPGVSNFVAVLDQTLLKSHHLLTHAAAGSTVLVATSWTAAELVSNIPPEVASLVRKRNLRLCTIDAKGLAADLRGIAGPDQSLLESLIVLLAFLRLYLGKAANEELVLKIARGALGEADHDVDLPKLAAQAWFGLVEVEIPAPEDVAEAAKPVALKDFEFNAIAVETLEGDTVVNGARLGSWHDAAKHLLFPSSFTPHNFSTSSEYSQNPALRPEISDRTYLITCTVNRRLTPDDYDRNVFHVEFDTRGTGLKYEIGEALGVHGWNDTQEVLDFCARYNVDPDRLVTIPVPGSDGNKMHTRTVFQALQQQIDLFGKPGKTFYSDLAEYATSQADRYALQFISSPEGSSTFKKLSEKDTVTFADVLRRYQTARPGIEILCELIGDIKPRHYSIASAQSVVGDRVDLLVVSVEWATPSGTLRYGQCTRYLAGLKVGQKVTVSIKPSVMKLPPNHLQPIIMAGLGTGAAPFRAFLQHRAWLASHLRNILYGEEIEAFILDNTITKAGLAFSRDGPRKVYIQHKMREDAAELARMLWDREGVFYLCGPTWPVPDVYEALVDALVEHTGKERSDAGAFLEGLKEEERYVLELGRPVTRYVLSKLPDGRHCSEAPQNAFNARNFWMAYATWLEARGYKLFDMEISKETSAPHWLPPYTATSAPVPYAFYHRDGCAALMPWQCMWVDTRFAFAQDSEGRNVAIKVIEADSEEENIYNHLLHCSILFNSDTFANVLPPLCILKLPHQFSFVVMPMWGDRMELEGIRTVKEIVDFMTDLLRGLAFLHEQRIAHRDIAQSNVMVNYYSALHYRESGRLLLLLEKHRSSSQARYCLFDFNLSKQFPLGRQIESYRSPSTEAFRGWDCYHPSDVYQGEFEYNPFAFDVACLGKLFMFRFAASSQYLYSGRGHSYGLCSCRMQYLFSTHWFPQASDFFEEIVRNLSEEELQASVSLPVNVDTEVTVQDCWARVTPAFVTSWSRYRSPPVPRSIQLLHWICSFETVTHIEANRTPLLPPPNAYLYLKRYKCIRDEYYPILSPESGNQLISSRSLSRDNPLLNTRTKALSSSETLGRALDDPERYTLQNRWIYIYR